LSGKQKGLYMFDSKQQIKDLEVKFAYLERQVKHLKESRDNVSLLVLKGVINEIQKEKSDLLDRIMSKNFADFAMARQATLETEAEVSGLYQDQDDSPDEESIGEIVNAPR